MYETFGGGSEMKYLEHIEDIIGKTIKSIESDEDIYLIFNDDTCTKLTYIEEDGNLECKSYKAIMASYDGVILKLMSEEEYESKRKDIRLSRLKKEKEEIERELNRLEGEPQ